MTFFVWIAGLAIVLGGILSAFRARKPSRAAMWATAYLVLVVGVVQVGLLYSYDRIGLPFDAYAWGIFALYNIGAVGVMAGRMVKGIRNWSLLMVRAGSILFVGSMVLLIRRSFTVPFAAQHILLLVGAAIILVGMSVGLVLSARNPDRNAQ